MVAKFFKGCLPLSSHHNEKSPSKTLDQVFKEAADGKDLMTGAEVINFLHSQGDEKLTPEQAQEFLGEASRSSSGFDQFFNQQQHHDNPSDGLDIAGFTKLLLNPNLNNALKPLGRSHDMTAPLSHYYVDTSHNTYLTGNQLTSNCSTTPIINALKKGCRVIELDCWGKRGKIKVLHGGTLTRSVKFEDCIHSIKEYAFVASDYPVILTIENHLKPELQVEAAKIMKEVFGDLLFVPNDDERPPLEFHSPEALKGKIIISDKPIQQPVDSQVKDDPDVDVPGDFMIGNESPDARPTRRRMFPGADLKVVEKGAQTLDQPSPEVPRAKEFEDLLYIYCQKPSEMKEKQTAGGPLVSGDRAIMANLSEPQLKKFLKAHPGSVIEYTKTNLGRVYPYGLRFDSSNADPMSSWSHGCQLAALNLQGYDRPSWLGLGFFRRNGGCGYVKKPEIFLPGSPLGYADILELPPKLRLKVKILLGTNWHKRFDLFKNPDFYVKVALHGIPTDNLKKRTKVIRSNKEPSWEDEEFEFLIRVPEIALLRLEVWEEDRGNRDDFAGQSVLPVSELRQGIRVVPLLSRKGVDLSSKLLCQITLEDIAEPQAANGHS